ncbi:MAG: T9SS type A sorting domain-containing protein [Candidatus Marinimicrobia bacterium]|nr:T9SS type A sorting domain-containing protein [Candidatus Neomarinimicrobiota bacterium]MCF7827403.1 T9SS type A sorting domain-containing protein [Candidatus Neomarinimicrobiota bacterium]MCF7881364.1 T9SS type A sorting domain-containing protein [Candidatus Neomarinimicrobiota bacterium]
MLRKAITLVLFVAFVGTSALYGQSILYLSTETNQPPSSSTVLTDKLVEWGYDITYKDIGNWGTPIITPENHDLMIVDEIISSSSMDPIGTEWPIPFLNFEAWGSDAIGLTNADNELSEKNIGTQPVTIIDESHSAVGGLSGDVSIVSEQADTEMLIHFLIDAEGAVGLTEATETGNWQMAAVDSGAALVEGNAPNRMITFGLHNNGIESLTDDAFTILQASIEWLLESPTVGVEDNLTNPVTYKLNQNYPNPFNPTTQISFTLQEQSQTTLKVYNSLGQLVETLVGNQSMSQGTHNVTFNGAGLPTGVYFYELTAGDYSEMNKMVLVK